jgi:hypothetical protein
MPWDAAAWNNRSITNNGEGEEVHERDGRDLPRDAPKTLNDRSIPSQVVTKQIPSVRANTRSENIVLPSHTTQEDTADVSSVDSSSRDGNSDIFVNYKWVRYKPVVKKPNESLIQTGKRVRTQRNFANSLSALGKAYTASEGDEDDADDKNPTSGADPGGVVPGGRRRSALV